MPYASINELPETVANVLPERAQDVFMAAFNSAYEEYKDPDDRRGDESREEVAFKVAWGAVKRDYEKGDDGKWHAK